MDNKAARPRRVKRNDQLDVLDRLKRNFAVRPFAFDNDQWEDKRIAKAQRASEEGRKKHLIREVDDKIKGIAFPAKEMAMIIRSWMKQDD